MNGKKSKRLRQMARDHSPGAVERDWVASPGVRTTAVNNPDSVRGMYLALKRAYKSAAHQGR